MSIRRALAFSFIDRYASMVLGIASTMVLARLLTPADIGVFSVTVVLMSLATTFRDFGAGQYLVQERELTTDRIRSVWAIQLGIGVLLALIAVAAAVPVARFYGDPRIRDILWVMSLSYLVNPFGSITYAWLMRNMRYDSLALMRFSATLFGTLTSVWLAWLGWGPMALAWGALANTTANAVVAGFLRPGDYPWLPGLKEIRRVLRFGTRLTSSTLIETATTGAPDLLLGKLQDLASVGLYSRANGLVAMFARLVTDSVNTVAVSMFAKAVREGGDLKAAFVRANAYVTALGWSFGVTLALLAYPLVRIMYGPQWDEAVGLARVLALTLVASMPAALAFQALLAAGAADILLGAVAMVAVVTIGAAAAGAYFGLIPMGLGLAAAAFVSSLIWLRQLHRVITIDWREYAAGLGKSVAVAMMAGVGPLMVVLAAGARPQSHLLGWLALGGAGALAGFLAGARLFAHPIDAELRHLSAGLMARLRWSR
jgi:O-antigen/teichoic acid export membrane protein